MSNRLIKHFLYVEDIEILVYLSFILASIIFIYGVYRRYRLWTIGGGGIPLNRVYRGIPRLIKYGLLQWKVLYRGYGGLMHTLIYIGILLLFIGTILRALEYDVTLRYMGLRILEGEAYLIFKLMLNIGGLLALGGLLMALYRRLLNRPRSLPDTLEDYTIILLLILIIVTGFILSGISTLSYRMDWIGVYDPVGLIFVWLFSGYEPSIVIELYRVIWIIHMLLAVFMVAYIPYTKLFHIITGGILNTLLARDYHPSHFPGVRDIDRLVERGGLPGANSVIEFGWKTRLDWDSCVKCARCTDSCPATLSGKPLSPMDLILGLRGLMDGGRLEEKIIPNNIDQDVVWSCVTCGACVYECPLLIHHVEPILDMRRRLQGLGENVPQEAIEASYNVMRYGNPLGAPPIERERFIEELVDKYGVEIAREDVEYDYIYWIGCQASYDPNVRESARALIVLLKSAGLKFAILPTENCCGEPVRRMGDELLFKELYDMNTGLLSRYKFIRLIVTCPHCYNVFKHEYGFYGSSIPVIHHTQLLFSLVRDGRLKIVRGMDGKITYHDPCYLCRWNNIHREPRELIRLTVSGEYIEMPRNRYRSLCCGGGGGHLYFEVKRGERISRLRYNEAIDTGADTIIVACPYCRVMFNSESRGEARIMDISELILGCITGPNGG